NAYLAAGADCVYPIGLWEKPALESFLSGVRGPVNVVRLPNGSTIAELATLGVARVSWGPLLFTETIALFEERPGSLRDFPDRPPARGLGKRLGPHTEASMAPERHGDPRHLELHPEPRATTERTAAMFERETVVERSIERELRERLRHEDVYERADGER